MPRQVQISREKLLKAAMDILIRDGFSAVNIKSIALEAGCSTQPVSWHFGNMDGLREALLVEAVKYAEQKMAHDGGDCIEAFRHIGRAYIDMAFDTPNLFRFVYMGESKKYRRGGIDSILTDSGNASLIKRMAEHLDMSEEETGEFFRRAIIYTHGIASLIAAGVLRAEKEQAFATVTALCTDLLSLKGKAPGIAAGQGAE